MAAATFLSSSNRVAAPDDMQDPVVWLTAPRQDKGRALPRDTYRGKAPHQSLLWARRKAACRAPANEEWSVGGNDVPKNQEHRQTTTFLGGTDGTMNVLNDPGTR